MKESYSQKKLKLKHDIKMRFSHQKPLLLFSQLLRESVSVFMIIITQFSKHSPQYTKP